MSLPSLTSAREWLDHLNNSRHALLFLFVVSMLETLLLPIPIELILIPWMLCYPQRKWAIAGAALAGNLTAAAVGYGLGAFAMEQWGDSLINLFGSQEAYDTFQTDLEQDGFIAVLSIGLVPLPFQIAMLGAGASGYNFLLFMLAAMLGRGIRYFGLALLVAFMGEAALRIWRRHSRILGLLGLVLFGIWVGYEMTA